MVVIGSQTPLRGVKVVASDLAGSGRIPASAVSIRYALADKDTGLPFEILSAEAPAEIAPDKAGGAVMPVWVSVKVPRDAKSGDYKGNVVVTADGENPVEVIVELCVIDWTMPDTKEFASHVGLTQSPESVAMRYKVPLWSPEHWKLVEKSLELMGQAGTKDVYITALRRTHFGNEHGMIRWTKAADGAIKPDLSIAEKYLDLAIKHLGKAPVVCLYCWEPYTGSNYGGRAANTGTKGMLYTLVDASGRLEEAEGPKWGTPEAREFWRPVFEGMREILKNRGMEGSLFVGVAGDCVPRKEAVEDLKSLAADARWVVQSHMKMDNLFGQPVGYLADVWNTPIAPDPDRARLYGWKAPGLRVTFPREGSSSVMAIRTPSPLVQYRVALEGMITAGIHGFARMGADFWNVLETPNRTYGQGRNIIGRYPESDWGQLYLGNTTPYVLAAGPDGALATARFEMIREGAQDMEARIFLEKTLLDPAARAKIGDDLSHRCQQLLDDRVRAILLGRTSWLMFAGGADRRERLYELAGEVAGKGR